MVQSTMKGLKTMTRRVVKMPKDNIIDATWWYTAFTPPGYISFRAKHANGQYGESLVKCPYGQKGDILWVRETWNVEQYVLPPEGDHDELIYFYKATETKYPDMKWRPSIFMPKTACRIHLKITSIRVERLQDIKSNDVIDEGAGSEVRQMWLFGLDGKGRDEVYRRSFEKLWESINGKGSWDLNPWVWVISFKKTDHGTSK